MPLTKTDGSRPTLVRHASTCSRPTNWRLTTASRRRDIPTASSCPGTTWAESARTSASLSGSNLSWGRPLPASRLATFCPASPSPKRWRLQSPHPPRTTERVCVPRRSNPGMWEILSKIRLVQECRPRRSPCHRGWGSRPRERRLARDSLGLGTRCRLKQSGSVLGVGAL